MNFETALGGQVVNANGFIGVSDAVAGTADPAFATDAGGTILAWNDGAHQLLGYAAADAVGQRCYALLAGCDVFGNNYCNPRCPLLGMAQRKEPISHFEISIKSSSGEMIPVGVSVLTATGGDDSALGIIHVLGAASETPARYRDPGGSVGIDRFGLLTPREEEVFGLMAEGRSTAEIAEELFIGATTVRHHVQGILSKLGVHSRLEAVVAFHLGPSRPH